MKHINTIILGAGPSGLCCSYYLKKSGVEHFIIEKKQTLHTWKNERWDSFTLVTPNWMTRIPEMEDYIPKNNEFMTSAEINEVFDKFIKKVNPQIYEGIEITKIYKDKNKFILKSENEEFMCNNLIVAIGLFNNPYIPQFSQNIDKEILQITASEYKKPSLLPNGNILVVGSGRSGIQIAYEIKKYTSKKVWLSMGSLRPIPTIYKNTNGVFWLNQLSGFTNYNDIIFYDKEDTVNENIKSKIYQNLGKCFNEDVVLAGRLKGIKDTSLIFEPNLKENIKSGNKFLQKMLQNIDEYINHHKINTPNCKIDFKIPEINIENIEEIEELDFIENDIKTIIWCTGFKPDYSFINIDGAFKNGYPIHKYGISDIDGLYFTGQELTSGVEEKSSFGIGLFAIADDAKYVVDNILKLNIE